MYFAAGREEAAGAEDDERPAIERIVAVDTVSREVHVVGSFNMGFCHVYNTSFSVIVTLSAA